MKITLISVDDELYCIGIRILCACLRKEGHQVQMLFLPQVGQKTRTRKKFQMAYSPKLLEEIWLSCADSDVVGISLMTNYFYRAVNITEYLKGHGIKAPILWGGVHPTVEPEACIEYADIICIGEGEDALIELVNQMKNGRSYLQTRNMWFKHDQEIIRNPLRPLNQNLDAIPFPDYSGVGHFLAVDNSLAPLTSERLKQFEGERLPSRREGISYPMMTSRGCPWACTYCCNSVYKRLYPNERRLRYRTIENVISEIKKIENEVERPSFVIFLDDNFCSQREEALRKFSEQYKRDIGIPFFCHCDPLTINEEKVKILLEGGCAKFAMGVETASERIATIYNRNRFHNALPKAISLLEKYRSSMKLPPSYQFIIDNPYETVEDTLETLRFAVNLRKPWDNPIFSLLLFPGTPLYETAKSEGHVLDKHTQIYGRDWHEHVNPFFDVWVKLYRTNFPRFFLRLLLMPVIARFLASDLLKPFWRGRIFHWS
jgi:anaerobic magnesium-protoporphyrin IX monomethyl ester cyclase